MYQTFLIHPLKKDKYLVIELIQPEVMTSGRTDVILVIEVAALLERQ